MVSPSRLAVPLKVATAITVSYSPSWLRMPRPVASLPAVISGAGAVWLSLSTSSGKWVMTIQETPHRRHKA